MESLFFETDKFNLSVEHENFINPCCFGEDFTEWLKPRLENCGVTVEDIYQEDWGWEMSCKENNQGYYLGVGGLPEEDNPNKGEWRVMFTKKRSLTEKVFGKNKLSQTENIISCVQKILSDTKFSKIQFEQHA